MSPSNSTGFVTISNSSAQISSQVKPSPSRPNPAHIIGARPTLKGTTSVVNHFQSCHPIMSQCRGIALTNDDGSLTYSDLKPSSHKMLAEAEDLLDDLVEEAEVPDQIQVAMAAHSPIATPSNYGTSTIILDGNTEEEDIHQEIRGNSSTEDAEDLDEEARFLIVSMDGDVEDLLLLLEDMARAGETLTHDMLNCADNSGRTPVSHLCGNGMIEMLELLEDIPHIDYNSPDSEGNTPLHFSAQAGHVEVVSFLLNKVRTIQVDPVNNLGFSPLMKAAIQGRIKCSKLLLFSGASPIRRDPGRCLTAAQWARFCGRLLCADSIEKFIRTAVPGGEALAEEATGKQKREKERRFPFRSSPNSSSASRGTNAHTYSWITRKFKKTFFAGSTSCDVDHSTSESLPSSINLTGSPMKRISGGRGGKKKHNVPQVHVTLEESVSEEEGGAEKNAPDKELINGIEEGRIEDAMVQTGEPKLKSKSKKERRQKMSKN